MLPYTAEVLLAFLAQYNRALWPAPLVALLLAAIGLALAVRPFAGAASGRLVAALLVLAWGWVGWVFFLGHFARLNFLAPAYGMFFLLQALLLAWSGLLHGRLAFRLVGGRTGWSGLALALAALVLLPLVGAFSGRLAGAGDGVDWASAPLVGLTPGPTALFTLGLLLLVRGRGRLHLAVVPLLWFVVAGFEAWVLRLPQDIILPILGAAGAVLLALKYRSASGPA